MGDAISAGTAERPLLSGGLRLLKDEKLAAMVAAGSDDAFGTLYRRHHQAIYRYCRSLVREESDARDALQNTMLAALSSLRARPIEGAFKPWLFRIAHNESISIVRRRAREGPSEAPPIAPVSDDHETRERLRVLVSDLNALPERQRGAIVMRELSGLSYAEIGAALGTSAAAGKQLVYEARTAMQELRDGHDMSCELVRERISARDRRLLRGRKVRAHLRGCQPCQDFEQAIRSRRTAFALLAPPLSPLVAAAVLQDVLAGGGGGAGAGGAGGAAAGVTGIASGGVPAVAGPVALKAAAAVLLAGTVGVGAYEAGNALFSGSATAPAAVARGSTAHGAAAGRDGDAGSEHAARAGPGRDRGGAARAAGAGRNKADSSAIGGTTTAGGPAKADDPRSSGAQGAQGTQASAGAGASNQGGSGSSDAAGAGSGGGESGGDSTVAGSPAGGSDALGSAGGSAGVDTGGGDPGVVDTGSGDTGGGDTGGGTTEPPPPLEEPPPPDPPSPPAGVPPGHGGTPPGHGGVPPGQVDGVPPGHRGNA